MTDIHSACWPVFYYEALCAAMGPRRACELLLTGRVFSAADRLNCKLVEELVAEFELEGRALQMAAGLSSISPAAVAKGLELTAIVSPENAGNQTRERFLQAARLPDFRQALAAVREGRKPDRLSMRSRA